MLPLDTWRASEGWPTCKATRAWLRAAQPSPAILPGLWGPDSQGKKGVCPGLGEAGFSPSCLPVSHPQR